MLKKEKVVLIQVIHFGIQFCNIMMEKQRSKFSKESFFIYLLLNPQAHEGKPTWDAEVLYSIFGEFKCLGGNNT